MLTFFSALMGVVVAGYSITHISSVLVVDLFQIKIVAVMITAISICGILNSINMVDGLNGLAGFILVTGFAVIGLISFAENDVQILLASVMAVVALISFLFWNWPRGKIFLGDGGAYFFGVYLALTCVMLVERNREISPFAALLICIYPFTDTLFSIYRRVLKRRNFGHADNLHLHTLIYRRYFSGRRKDVSNNSRAGLVVALFSLPPAVCAYVFRSKEEMAIVCCLAFGAAYVVSYKKVVNFTGSCFKFHKFNREIKNENKR
jgi:UDP-N-acetylmuramyl pentapeptide phosphotransferase/UDP-N-acetylglucosamine-1-phosphate transferase